MRTTVCTVSTLYENNSMYSLEVKTASEGRGLFPCEGEVSLGVWVIVSH